MVDAAWRRPFAISRSRQLLAIAVCEVERDGRSERSEDCAGKWLHHVLEIVYVVAVSVNGRWVLTRADNRSPEATVDLHSDDSDEEQRDDTRQDEAGVGFVDPLERLPAESLRLGFSNRFGQGSNSDEAL
jgi:hypothetical protein